MMQMNLNYLVEGKGSTLVLIHGLSDDLRYWEPLAGSLKKDYKIIRFDLRGHGESELGEDEITIGTYVNDLKNLLDELNIKKAGIIGFSLGGAIAIDFAIKYPEYVSSIVLMSAFFKCDEKLRKVFYQMKTELNKSFEDFYDFMLPKILCPDILDNNREELELIKQIASQNANIEAYEKAVDAGVNFNAENNISQINIPTLILAGKYDEITTVSIQKTMHKLIKTSKLIIFDNLKHNLLIGKNNLIILENLTEFFKNCR